MKKQIIKYTGIFCLVLMLFVIVLSAQDENSTIPLLAGICDIIGVGYVTGTWIDNEKYEQGIIVEFDDYWRGNPGTNVFTAFMYTNEFQVTSDQMVFFMSIRGYNNSNDWHRERGYSYIFKREVLPEYKPWFFGRERSMFPASDTNLVNFTTNLIHAVDTNNTNLFYEIIRDGYNLNPEGSRIYNDSWITFDYCDKYFTTNFMVETMWWDPLLQRHPRGSLINNYHSKTWIWLHEVLPRP